MRRRIIFRRQSDPEFDAVDGGSTGFCGTVDVEIDHDSPPPTVVTTRVTTDTIERIDGGGSLRAAMAAIEAEIERANTAQAKRRHLETIRPKAANARKETRIATPEQIIGAMKRVAGHDRMTNRSLAPHVAKWLRSGQDHEPLEVAVNTLRVQLGKIRRTQGSSDLVNLDHIGQN